MRLLDTLTGKPSGAPPIWLMRQAGRYLPEYRDVRAKAGGFLDLCYTPALAAEVTLQPIRRYGFDAAIIFSDILVVPHALGQEVRFEEGEGPRLDPIRSVADLRRLDRKGVEASFAKVCEAIALTRQQLPKDVALIGFCGAPWTVATYMVGGAGSSDQAEARLWAYRDRKGFARLIDLLVETSVDYLVRQVKAGANVLQIFDSWAGSLPDDETEAWVTKPTARIVTDVHKSCQGVPIIGFPRGAGDKAEAYIAATGIDAIGCDTAMPIEHMQRLQKAGVAVQGNLDPLLLVAGGDAFERRVRLLLESLSGGRHIFNLGHGIVPQTPPEHVARLMSLVRGGV